MKKLILFVVLFIGFANAEVQGTMTKLGKGDKAPYDGILSDSQQMKFFRYQNEKLLKSTDLIEEQNKLYNLQKQQSDEYKGLYHQSASDLRKVKVQSTFSKAIYFGLGVLVTGVAIRFSGRK
jgi:hypothetical protein